MKSYIFTIIIFACISAHADHQLPDWLEKNRVSNDSLTDKREPLSVWKLSYQKQEVYYVVSPCCDQYNYLYDLNGTPICAPTGGIAGKGDGKCPFPADTDKSIELVWKSKSLEHMQPPNLYPLKK